MAAARERSRRLWPYAKPLADMALIALSFAGAYWVRYELQWIRQVEPGYLVPLSVYVPSVIALAAIVLFVYWLEGAYRQERGRTFYDDFYIILRGSLTGIAMMIVFVFLATPSYYSRLIFGYTGILTLILVSSSRAAEHALVARRRKRGIGVVRVLVAGVGEIGRSVMRSVVARPELGYQIVGFVDDDPERAETDIGRFPALGMTERVPELIASHQVDEVIIALPWSSQRTIMRIVGQCRQENVSSRIVPDLFQLALSQVVVENLDGIPLIGVQEPTMRDWQVFVKRAIDVVLAALGLVLLSPLFLAVALAIKLETPGEPVFRQTRMGKDGIMFTCFKFRSMCVDAENRIGSLLDKNEATGPLFKMRDDPRTTRVGSAIRRFSLDELPQLWNVLRGDMSLIGPRPAMPEEVNAYQPWHLRRLEVAPGMSGLWQVSGRSDLSFDEMVLLDIYYIENWSPILDLRILLRTLPTVILGTGAY